MTTVVGVGWDVGGWHGKGNAVVVVRWTGERVQCLGAGCERLPVGSPSLADFVAHFCRAVAATAVRTAVSVVVAIDAPLGFPTAFRELLTDPTATPQNPRGTFIDNRLAFRETDREIARRFPRKPPLSASFDKLGNPATVAMRHAYAWTRGAGPLVTRDATPAPGLPAVIEVYPALSKEASERKSAARARYRAHIDPDPHPHLYDAAISAVLALGWAVGDDARLPRLAVTASEPGEGAIWYPAHSDWTLPPKERSS